MKNSKLLFSVDFTQVEQKAPKQKTEPKQTKTFDFSKTINFLNTYFV